MTRFGEALKKARSAARQRSFNERVISERRCTVCDRPILTVNHDGFMVESEYCDDKGRCFECAAGK